MAEKDYGPRIGADPEVFVQTLEGELTPVCGKVGGTKENPLIIDHLIEASFGPEGGRRGRELVDKQGSYAVQEDNVMLEFNIPAYRDRTYVQDSIGKILSVLETQILDQRGLKLKYDVSQTFKADDLAKYPQAFTVGCLPDLNAYAEIGRFERPSFNAINFGNNRFCGGHIHVQYNYDNVPRHIFAQFMDLVAELPSLRWDKQKMRRMFYGQPGIYREKPYGIEYRTLSNFWIVPQFRDKWFSVLLDNIYSLAMLANENPEELKQHYSKIDWGDVQHAIKTEDIKLAEELVNYARTKLHVPMGPMIPK